MVSMWKHMDNKEEFLLFPKHTGYGNQIYEKISSLQTRLYFTYIKPIEYVACKIYSKISIHFKIGMIDLGTLE